MATATQSIRFIGPAPSTGAGNLDALNRVLADLCTRGSPKVFTFSFPFWLNACVFTVSCLVWILLFGDGFRMAS